MRLRARSRTAPRKSRKIRTLNRSAKSFALPSPLPHLRAPTKTAARASTPSRSICLPPCKKCALCAPVRRIALGDAALDRILCLYEKPARTQNASALAFSLNCLSPSRIAAHSAQAPSPIARLGAVVRSPAKQTEPSTDRSSKSEDGTDRPFKIRPTMERQTVQNQVDETGRPILEQANGQIGGRFCYLERRNVLFRLSSSVRIACIL